MNPQPVSARLLSACLHICCLYAVYMTLVIGIGGMKTPFTYLIPGYFIAALLNLSITDVLSSKKYIRMTGIITGLIYAFLLIFILTRYSPWAWLMESHELFLKSPLTVIRSKCDELTISGMGVLLWFLGFRQARVTMDFPRLFGEFQLGFGLLFIVCVITHGFGLTVQGLSHIVCLFFLLGLSVLFLSRHAAVAV